MANNFADLYEHSADAMPDRVAVIEGDRELSFAELDANANRLAHYLASIGVRTGTHVGFQMHNGIATLETLIACFKIRAVPININYRYRADELRYVYDNADLEVLIYHDTYAEAVREAAAQVESLRTRIVVGESDSGAVPYTEALAAGSPDRDFGPRSAEDLFMMYTGGTTGLPKGVMWRQEDMWRVLGGGINFVTGDRIEDEWQQAKTGAGNAQLVRYPIPPLIHGGSQCAVFHSLFDGGKAIMLPEFSGHGVWQAIDKHTVNLIFITGDAMARPMLDALREGNPETGAPYQHSNLWAMASSAALFSPTIKDQFMELLTTTMITDSIGSSETGFGGLAVVAKGQTHTGGPRVKIDASTEVLHDDGTPVTPGSGEIGFIARKGHIPLGYYGDEAKTKATFKEFNGVRYSIPGDYARVEEDGTVTMLGRGSVSINSGGEKIYP
ncbi:acyl-CoA synthetase, partial [Streptomyces roseolus]|uniref:acyl-CoA synthetase n=1 Tax=Streptomyces roseolus TaxID=67358 RepID=UPI00364D8707